MQQLTCPKCQASLEYGDKKPSFCAYCGQALTDHASKTAPASPSGPTTATFDPEAPTVPPPSGPVEKKEDADPESISGYRLLRVLGSGGMGKVFEAEDVATSRRVALKLISADFVTSSETVQRFRQEGRLASMVTHPRCVFVLAADEEAGRPFIVMELMPGNTLQDLVKEKGALPPGDAVQKILDVIEGLEEAHQLGVVHRDVKPSNCFLDREGRVKIGDFGLSKSLVSTSHLTRTGAFMGTPLYSSPEQIRGEKVDQQTDVYAVAATLYCLLTGKAPFQTTDAAATLARIVADEPPPMRSLRQELSPALDRVVLRGLERDRKKRWHSLEEFRLALLPFAPGQLNLAGLAARFTAYLVDYAVLGVSSFIAGMLYAWLSHGNPLFMTDPAFSTRAFFQVVPPVLWFVYFLVSEGVWDASPGKRLLGLRVCPVSSNDAPGLLRGAARIAVFYLLVRLGDTASKLWLWRQQFNPEDFANYDSPIYKDPSFLILLGMIYWGLQLGGLGLLWCCMRRRNGYRGLHEFASGTHVIALPQGDKRGSVPPRRLDEHLDRAGDLPGHVEHFKVRGLIRRAGAGSLLLAEDTSLGRDVLVWLRPATEPPLPAARREVARPARLRWLAGGHIDGQQWDAVLAPSGRPLADVVAASGPLPWKQVRPVLEQLTEELTAAVADDTLPFRLSTDQVWLHARGRVLLLDAPLGEHPAGATPAAEGSRDETALALLRQTAALALEGKPRVAGDGGPIRAPVPGHMAEPLARLLGGTNPFTEVGQWQKALAASKDQPAEVTRGRRIGHLALQAAFLFFGLSCMMPLGFVSLFAEITNLQDIGILERAIELGQTDAYGGVVAALNPQPLVQVVALHRLNQGLDLRPRLELARDRLKERSDACLSSLSPAGRQFAISQGEARVAMFRLAEEGRGPMAMFAQVRIDPRIVAKHLAERTDGPPAMALALGFAIYLCIWPVAWVVWAFLTRGGFSLRMIGLQLVQADGRRAARWRCAARALLVWVPLLLLLLASIGLELQYWEDWQAGVSQPWMLWSAWLAWCLAMILPVVYVALDVLYPIRSLHDRLVGTYLVPR
jgi:hypothetical protein